MKADHLQKFALTAEIVGGVAVLVTLLILIFQVRDNTNALRMEEIRAARERLESIYLYQAENKELYTRAMLEPEKLTIEEITAFSQLYYLKEGLLMRVYDSYLAGIISETDWNRWLNGVTNLFADPLGQIYWQESRPYLTTRPDFVQQINDALEAKGTDGGDDAWIIHIQDLIKERL